MRVLILWRIAVRNLLQGGRRSLLLGLAIALVTGLLVLLGSLSAGLESTMIRAASTLMSGHVNVGGFFKVTATQAAPVVTDLAKLRGLVEANVEDVDLVIDRLRGWGKIISDSGSFMASVSGIDIAEERRLIDVLQVVPPPKGKLPGDLKGLAEPNTVVIFESQAKRLDVWVGDVLTVSAETVGGVQNTAEVRVVAVARDVGFLSAFNLFVPKATVRTLYQIKEDATGVIQIYLKDPERASVAMDRLRPVLADAGYKLLDHDPQSFFMKFERVSGEDWKGQRLDLTTWQDEISFLGWILAGFASIRVLLLGGLLVIIVVGIMNTMWMTIRERTREIGTLRAIGMRRRGVLAMFVFEGVALGLGSSTVGAIIGAAAAWGIDAAQLHVPMEAFQMVLMSDRLHLEVQFGGVLGAVGIISVITTLAVLYPAWRAARLRPVNAMHHV
jgi:ABC-type lipoprotein release transport system permease subunit